MKGRSEFVTSYMGPWLAQGLRGAREQALCNFPKFQHCSPVQTLSYPADYYYDFLHQDHSACSNDLTPSD